MRTIRAPVFKGCWNRQWMGDEWRKWASSCPGTEPLCYRAGRVGSMRTADNLSFPGRCYSPLTGGWWGAASCSPSATEITVSLQFNMYFLKCFFIFLYSHRHTQIHLSLITFTNYVVLLGTGTVQLPILLFQKSLLNSIMSYNLIYVPVLHLKKPSKETKLFLGILNFVPTTNYRTF